MAPRANWKGFLRLSLVTCPIALFPATSESEKISFNQINKKTGHRIRYLKVDADTGEEVPNEDIIKGYQVDKDRYLEVTKDELENIALESTRTIEIDEFVPRSEIDDLYLVRPYYIVPDGKVGHDAFAVIRETIRSLDKVALARVVLTNREHVIALEAREKGLVGTLLRYPYEVRNSSEYFDDIQDVKITKDMLDLAKHIVEQKSGDFEPQKFEDRYESALSDLLAKKQKGEPISTARKTPLSHVVNLMEALRQSLASADNASPAAKATKTAKGAAVRKLKASQTEPEPRTPPGALARGHLRFEPGEIGPDIAILRVLTDQHAARTNRHMSPHLQTSGIRAASSAYSVGPGRKQFSSLDWSFGLDQLFCTQPRQVVVG
jgi:DNA end-binding protein Ku